MKSLLLNLGSQILRDVIANQGAVTGSILSSFLGANQAATPRPAPRPDYAYLTRFAKRLFTLAAVGFVCTLFFVMGAMMAIGAVAQSIDLFGVFVASTVFYTGGMIAALGLCGLLLCITRARKHSFSWDFFFRHTEEAVTITASEIRPRAGFEDSSPQKATRGPGAEVATPAAAFASPSAAPYADRSEPLRPGPERIAS